MSVPAEPVSPAPAILKPYTADPDARKARGRRRSIWFWTIGLCLFYGIAWAFLAPYLILVFLAPIGLMGLVAIWALPEARTAPTKTLSFLFFAFFLCLVMWPNYLALALPGLPWITMARLTGFPLAFFLLVCVSLSADFRSKLASSLNAAPYVWRFFVAFLVLQTVSLAFSHQFFYSLDRYFIWQTSCTVIFFTSCYIFTKPCQAQRMVALMWAMAIGLCVIGLIEKYLEHVPWFGHIPSFLQIEGDRIKMILAGQRRAGDGIYRVQATYTTSLALAEYLALCMPFVMHAAIASERFATRLAAVASVPLLLLVVFITGSRLGMVGCLASVLAYTLAWGILRWRRDRGSLFGPAITLAYPALFVAAIATTVFIGRIRTAVWGNGAADSSNEGRQIQMAMGIPKIIAHPWGYGVGMGGETLGYYDIGGLLTIDSHYLLTTLEYGVVGFIIYYGIFLLSIFYGFKNALAADFRKREFSLLIPATIAMVNFFIIKSVFSQEDNHSVAFMLLGMIVALCWRVQKHNQDLAAHGVSAPGDNRSVQRASGGEIRVRHRKGTA